MQRLNQGAVALIASVPVSITWFTKFSQLRKLAGLDIIRV